VRAQVAHHLQDFLVLLAKPQQQAELGGTVWIARLEILQQLQRMRIVGARACRFV
jgi:hypothetical protein